MLGVWMAGKAFPDLRTCWKCFKMTDLQCALNFLHYWLCQRRFHRQLPSCEFISSCCLPPEHTQLLMHKILFCCFCPITLLPPALSSGCHRILQPGMDNQQKKAYCEAEVTAHMTALLHTPINKNKNWIASPCTRLELSITPSANTLMTSCATSHSPQPFLLPSQPPIALIMTPAACTTLSGVPKESEVEF